MRLLLDATAVPADRGGVGRYVDALLPALADLGVELVVACQPRDAQAYATLVPAARVVPAPGAVSTRPARLAWEQTGLPRLTRSVRADLLHSPHYTLPLGSPVPVVVTVHDATFFSHPDVHTAVKGRFFRTWTRTAVRRASAIVVPSAATRDELGRYTGADRSMVHVAHHGVDRALFSPPSGRRLAEARAAIGLGEDEEYVAFLGTLEPRKNVPALVEGWVRASLGRREPPVLVLAGGQGWDPGVVPAIESVPAPLRVVRTGYLDVHHLAGFLAGATVVAYPSLGEGFGLPVLEAMACGSVVLTTKALSLPEVGGRAVSYCGPAPEQIGDALTALLDDPSRRVDLSRAALERAATFTWQASARAHVHAYEAALSG